MVGSNATPSDSHFKDVDKGLLRGILSGGVWNGFLLGKVPGEKVPCRLWGAEDGHFFWDCKFPLFVHIKERPEFPGIVECDKRSWLR